MSDTAGESAALERTCEAAVMLLMARNGWQLLDQPTFVQRTVAAVRTDVSNDPTRAATFVYSQALHAACSGAEGEARRNQGYTELFRYLYAIASYRYPALRNEIAQHATEQTFIAFERCRDPGTLFAFANQHLMNAARAVRRQTATPHQSLDMPLDAEGLTLGDVLSDPQAADLAEELLATELRATFERLLAEFLEKYPRAAKQITALRQKYFDDLDDEVISQQLGTSVKNVYLLRHRALLKLRDDDDWRALAAEFGIVLNTTT